jgi:hypothetical protein
MVSYKKSVFNPGSGSRRAKKELRNFMFEVLDALF